MENEIYKILFKITVLETKEEWYYIDFLFKAERMNWIEVAKQLSVNIHTKNKVRYPHGKSALLLRTDGLGYFDQVIMRNKGCFTIKNKIWEPSVSRLVDISNITERVGKSKQEQETLF
jgi:hypothetical protein